MPDLPRRPLLSPFAFVVRIAFRFSIALAVVLVSLGVGAFGYHRAEGWPWLDAVLNAAMILTGMGPVNTVQTTAGKLFATSYALFSGVFFLTVVALLFAPILHRFLHRFHLELYADEDESGDSGQDGREKK